MTEKARSFQAQLQDRLGELQEMLEEEITATDNAILSYGLEESLSRSRQMLADRLIGLRSLSILRADARGDFKVVVDVRTEAETRPTPSVSDRSA